MPPPDFSAIHSTNPSTKFKEWTLQLPNGATLTGISHIPPSPTPAPTAHPLIVGIHGATCSAYNWDPHPAYTASLYSTQLSVPFVAFHRPNFLGSSGWVVDRAAETPDAPAFKAPEGQSYFQEEARWYHELIFPALWKEFAVPNGCSALVTTSHSMAVPMTVIAGGLYAKAAKVGKPGYVWAGMVLSGTAEVRTQHSLTVSETLGTNEYAPEQLPFGQDARIHLPPYYRKDSEELMLGAEGVCEAELRPLVWKQNTPFLIQEIVDLVGMWPQNEAAYKAEVTMPVLYGLGEFDWVWKGNKENVDAFCADFKNSPRVEAAVVRGAPHAIEWSKVARGWWTRVFGWSIEVASEEALKDSGLIPYP